MNGNTHEDYYSRRLREKREEAARQEKQQAKQQTQQKQQQAQQDQYALWAHAIGKFANVYVGERLRRHHEEVVAPTIATLEAKNAALQSRIEKLESLLALDKRFNELERNLAAKQAAIDEARRGEKGERGLRGARGERGPRGEKGEKGERGASPRLHSVQIDREKYRMVLLFDDGTSWEPLEFRPFLEQFLIDRGEY